MTAVRYWHIAELAPGPEPGLVPVPVPVAKDYTSYAAAEAVDQVVEGVAGGGCAVAAVADGGGSESGAVAGAVDVGAVKGHHWDYSDYWELGVY